MDNILIRRATLDDAPALVAFNQAIARETEHRELPAELLTPGVTALLQHPERGFYLVAEADQQVRACLLVTYEWSDWRNGMFWWVQSVYVQANYRRRGLYRRLYQFVQQLAETPDPGQPPVCGFRLYVEQDNHIAQATYRALGMAPTPYQIYEQLTPPSGSLSQPPVMP